MTSDAEVKFEWQLTETRGIALITVLCGDVVFFQSELKTADPKARETFIESVLERAPGLAPEDVDQQLLKIAHAISKSAAAPSDSSSRSSQKQRDVDPRANCAAPSGAPSDASSRRRPRNGWVPAVGMRVRTNDDGRKNIGEVVDVDIDRGMVEILWISPEGSQAQKWISLSTIEPLESPSVPSRLRGADRTGKGKQGTTPSIAPPWKPFPIELFPDLLRRFAIQQAAALGVDVAFIAGPLLAVIAAAIGNARRLRIKRDWIVPAVIWFLLVVESGGMKSPALRSVLQWLRAEEERLARDYESEIAAFMKTKATKDIEKKKWAEAAKKAKGKFDEPPPIPDDAPKRERRIVEDATVEALAPILKNSPRGLLVWRDEASGWFDSLNEYKKKGGDAARWNAMYDGGAISVDRKGGDAPSIYIKRATVSILGGIQPGVLGRRLTPESMESGLLARFLLMMPPRSVKRWTDLEVDPELLREMEAMFRELFRLEMEPGVDRSLEPKEITFTPEARDVWAAFVDEHGEKGSTLVGDDASWWSKLEGVAARIALIFALARSPTTDVVDECDVNAGIGIARWFADEIDRVRILLCESEGEREERALIELIRRKDGRITARDLAKASRRFENSKDAEGALEALVATGRGKWEQIAPLAKGGRPTRVFVLCPDPVGETAKPSETEESDGTDDASPSAAESNGSSASSGVSPTGPEVSPTDAGETPAPNPDPPRRARKPRCKSPPKSDGNTGRPESTESSS